MPTAAPLRTVLAGEMWRSAYERHLLIPNLNSGLAKVSRGSLRGHFPLTETGWSVGVSESVDGQFGTYRAKRSQPVSRDHLGF